MIVYLHFPVVFNFVHTYGRKEDNTNQIRARLYSLVPQLDAPDWSKVQNPLVSRVQGPGDCVNMFLQSFYTALLSSC
jgi:hypothetical protein